MTDFFAVTLTDDRWNTYVNNAVQYDFYQTSCYHALEKKGRPLLFIALFGDDFIGLPLIMQEIEGTDYWDCTSAYGYCGPISNLAFEDISPSLCTSFQDALKNYFLANNIVSAFSRLHPVIIGDKVFDGFGSVRDVNQTVAIDLRMSPEVQRQQYRKSNKSEVNQLRGKKGYRVKEAENTDEIRQFIRIYHETMNRVGAKDNYYFDEDYFFRFLDNTCFSNRLLLAVKENVIAAGAIFTITNKMMQYHLAGTKNEFIADTPMKIILDEARMLGNDLGMDFLHLGGGVGGRDDDSLFRFKSGFSKERFMYRVWSYIADKAVYDELCEIRLGANHTAGDYFPLYRAT